MDYEDWHKHVHGTLPYQELLKADPELRRILESLPQEKWIFTNADIRHTETCLGILGIRDLFKVSLPQQIHVIMIQKSIH